MIGIVNITTLNNRQYCVILDPVDDKGVPQMGKKKLVKGEKSFFLQPGELLEKGIQNIFVLGEDEGLILKANEEFVDKVSRRSSAKTETFLNRTLRRHFCRSAESSLEKNFIENSFEDELIAFNRYFVEVECPPNWMFYFCSFSSCPSSFCWPLFQLADIRIGRSCTLEPVYF